MNLYQLPRLVAVLIIISTLITSPIVTPAQARQSVQQPIGNITTLSTILNPNGTLNLQSGFNGSLDARGWSLVTTADGHPQFINTSHDGTAHKPDIAGDEWWSGKFQIGVSAPGFSSNVYAVAVSGSDVYIGGYFTRAGGIAANSLVHWNTATRRWSTMGSGAVGGTIYAIAVHGTSVYVGGNLNDLGGQSMSGIGRWNTVTQAWSGLGPGLTSGGSFAGVVRALAFDGSGHLIVGGYFDHAGSVAVMNIAKWDGTNWSALGAGIGTNNGTDEVYTLAASGSEVYAGGYFTNPSSNIARWDGANWQSLGGTNGIVDALLLNGSTLYVGGSFTSVGVVNANRIAAWNGTNWTALGAGTNDTVESIALGSDGLYIGGLFTQIDNNPGNYVAKWTGSAWSNISTNLDAGVYALAASGTNVYAGGAFLSTDAGIANHITKWSTLDNAWLALGNSPDGVIYAVTISGSAVYVGGTFTSVSGLAAHNIAKWNSATGVWSTLGDGAFGCTGVSGCSTGVYAIAVNGADVYVGGNFTGVGPGYNGAILGDISTGPVARWNSVSGVWTPSVLAGSNPCCDLAVYALVTQGSGVDVGGSFLQTLCGNTVCNVNNVMYWNGLNTYVPFSDGVTTGVNLTVKALLYDGSGVYIGGSFTSPDMRLVYFDGENWLSAAGSGLNGTVDALAVDNHYLYAGGSFNNAGGSGANRIARLPLNVGGDWQMMGTGLNGTVAGLAWSGKDLIAAGLFTQSGLLGVNHIARWNTTTETWAPLGSGTSDLIEDVAATSDAIYVGGVFTSAGGQESDSFARWAHFQTYLPLVIK